MTNEALDLTNRLLVLIIKFASAGDFKEARRLFDLVREDRMMGDLIADRLYREFRNIYYQVVPAVA
jgi:pentatricopeptide repeat protein